MRRKDKEITDRLEIEEILHKAHVCRIAMCDDGLPYIVPMNYGYKEDCLYLHCAREGKKLDILAKNNQVCFEIDTDLALAGDEASCEYTYKYRSIIGFGKACLVENFDEKKKGLDIIMEHYTGKNSFTYPDKAVNAVVVIRVEIESMTGKRS